MLTALAAKIKESGLRAAVLTKHAIGGIFGFYMAYNALYNTNMNDDDKILHLNSIIKEIEETDLPDVLLMEAPDAVMKYTDGFPNGSGIHSYILTQAVVPDYFICCLPYDLAINEFIEDLSRGFVIRFGVPIGAVHVSNLTIDNNDSVQYNRLTYSYIAHIRVLQQINVNAKGNNGCIPAYDVINGGIDDLFDHLLNSGK